MTKDSCARAASESEAVALLTKAGVSPEAQKHFTFVPDFKKLRFGPLQHEFVATLAAVQQLVQSRRYKKAMQREQQDDIDLSQPEYKYIVPHRDPNKRHLFVYCKLTKRMLNNDTSEIRAHVSGRRYQNLLKVRGKRARPDISPEVDVSEVAEFSFFDKDAESDTAAEENKSEATVVKKNNDKNESVPSPAHFEDAYEDGEEDEDEDTKAQKLKDKEAHCVTAQELDDGTEFETVAFVASKSNNDEGAANDDDAGDEQDILMAALRGNKQNDKKGVHSKGNKAATKQKNKRRRRR